MTITNENYELWFLDYLEGNLKESMIDDFLEFLSENPDLGEELHLFESVGLTKSEVSFSDKRKLYKEDFDLPDVFETAVIGLFEGDLEKEEHARFTNYLEKHPEKQGELQLFKSTKLIPEQSVIFKNKTHLYRQPVVFFLASRIIRIAAVFVFILALSFLPEKRSEDLKSENPSFVFISDSQTSVLSTKTDNGNISSWTSKKKAQEDQLVTIPGKRDLAEEKPVTVTSFAEQAPPDSPRKSYPSMIFNQDPPNVYLILSNEPGLMTPAFKSETYAINESENVPLSQRFFQKIGLSDINPGKMVRWGLSFAANLTKEKFNYATDASGEIVALNLDTRLVGLSIPVNRK